MNVQEINDLLIKNQNELDEWFSTVDEERWVNGPEGKWTAGQHLLHLIQGTKPLIKAVSMPSFILKYKFGKCNRNPRTFNEVVERYHEKLEKAKGIVSPFSKNMPSLDKAEINGLMLSFANLNKVLAKKSLKLKSKNLDVLLIPHPLMGKMTIREILMWNAYHLKHHYSILKQKY